MLARDMGGWRAISWALVLSLPVTVAGDGASRRPAAAARAAARSTWLGFAYVALVSMFLAFFAWYAGLARGGVAKIGQVQLAQPLLTLGWSALLLGEHVDALTLLAAMAVLASVVAHPAQPAWSDVTPAAVPTRDGRGDC